MDSVFQYITNRYSVRTYSSRQVEEEKQQQIRAFLGENQKGPFGNDVRFELVDASAYNSDELKKLGTYGIIKGTRLFIAGAVKKGDKCMEDYGYCMEKNILMATSLGLGTCWLAGMLNRSTFASRIHTTKNEIIPAITPLGYEEVHRSARDRLIRFVAGSKNRKKFEELFFHGDTKEPLDKVLAGEYANALEAVRVAPSASNKQPWRVIKEKNKNRFHFYLNEDAIYNNAIKGINIQNNDIGIGMCHFELTSREKGLPGEWETLKPEIQSGVLKYIVSWVG